MAVSAKQTGADNVCPILISMEEDWIMNLEAEVKRFYSNHGSKCLVTLPPLEIEEFLKQENALLKQRDLAGKNVLEIGCGYGRLMKIMARTAKFVLGIDYCQAQLKLAEYFLNDLDNVSCSLMDAQALAFEIDSFDEVVCLNALFSNLPGLEEKVLAEMKRVCRPDGRLALTMLAENSEAAQIANYRRLGLNIAYRASNYIVLSEGLYSRRFSRDDLNGIFRNVGGLKLEIEKFCEIGYVATAQKIE